MWEGETPMFGAISYGCGNVRPPPFELLWIEKIMSHEFIISKLMRIIVMILTSKLFTCFIDGFTLGMKSQWSAYFPSGNAHTYVGFWDLKVKCTQYKSNVLFGVGRGGQDFGSRSWNLNSLNMVALAPYPPYGIQNKWQGWHPPCQSWHPSCPMCRR